MAKKYRFYCSNEFGPDACELGKQGFPNNKVEFTLAELKGLPFPPKCPKCPHALTPLDPVPAGISGAAPGQESGPGPTGSSAGWLLATGGVLVLGVVGYFIYQWIMGGAQISVRPPAVDFGKLNLGTSSSREVIVKNTGKRVLKVTGLTTSNPAFRASEARLEVAPGQEKKLSVSFTANTSGIVTGKLNLVSNDSQFPNVTITLTGSIDDNPWKELDEYYQKSTIITQ